LVLSTKRLVAAGKFLVAATKILFFIPNFVAETKPFFFVLVDFPWWDRDFKSVFVVFSISPFIITNVYLKDAIRHRVPYIP